LTGEAGKTGWSWLVTGQNLTWRLRAENGKATLQVGWPVPDEQGKQGATCRAETYALEGEPTEAAVAGMLAPAGLQATVGTPVPGRVPYSYEVKQGAVVLHVGDLGDIPFEWIPLEIRGLRTDATAYYLEEGSAKIRPLGVDPDGVGRVVLWRGKHDCNLFLGHPLLCSDPDIHYDAVRLADGTWIVDANNPTDQDRKLVFFWNPAYPGSGPLPAASTLARGARLHFTLKEEPHA